MLSYATWYPSRAGTNYKVYCFYQLTYCTAGTVQSLLSDLWDQKLTLYVYADVLATATVSKTKTDRIHQLVYEYVHEMVISI